ncbi:hypothetical protein [Legionella drancourtii]|uniref:Transmembrane protein n=1 Tax=Legionella drancourtii LLAP12 TaxID=658187 RepID=G9EPM2_9GAMM|nr:hypothetical protein [Legionella drancourtii]EHL30795.1 hypothetical protein LDG_7224 [Legionella drancourtii LLAP12]
MAATELKVFSEADAEYTVNNQTEAYRVRYIELTKAIAGAFLGCIYYLLTRTTTLTGSPLVMVGSTLANFISWVIGEQLIHRLCVYFKLYTATKSKNPLYRNFKTLASVGFSLGIILAIVFSSSMDIKLEVSICSASVGFILGLFAFAFRHYRQSRPIVAADKKNIDAQVGTEGWSKYSKLALTFGTSIGQSIGGYIAYVGGYDAIHSWNTITLYGAIAAIISFLSVIILVPIINYLTRDATKMGLFVVKDKDVFNSNYIRTGMTLGVAIGTILGSLLGPLLFTGLSVSLGIAVGTGVCSIIFGITLGIYGHKLSLYLQNNWGIPVQTDNSWSYASRNTSYVFGFLGTAIACLLCPGAALLQSAAIGAAISGLAGWFVGIGVIWKARQVEAIEKKSTVPWTQRISSGATRGSIIGAFFGLILALTLCTGGSLGLVGLITLSSALGGILGSLKEGIDDTTAKELIEKMLFEDNSYAPIMAVATKNVPSPSIINTNQGQESSSTVDQYSHYSSNGSLLFFSSNPVNVAQEILETHENSPARNSIENRNCWL